MRQAGHALQHHRVFGMVRDLDDLRLFMRWHVFAVWDFMSLVKRLQMDLTCVSLPWMPPRHPKAARLVNEIVLGEESDETLSDGHTSHYDLYLEAMREVGVEPLEVNRFLNELRNGRGVSEALQSAQAPTAVADFVRATLLTAETGSTYEVLGSFFYGRENVIPTMFSALLAEWAIDEASVPTFVYYLKRHIELDGDAHGPAAEAIIDELVADDLERRLAVVRAAVAAVRARIALWDALADALARQDMAAA
ncbi:MAG: mangotoxin biosynthesis-involved protein MgoB [Lysobacterales bacterium 69-70]|nr:MAG: mangotoxin biosynthesis-involved protein MgoB [Xanthomonadaceae bacterium SCN 69-320]ODV20613.1 MAG: mangotoxin biosynthesis-involved protein MgoB [Xanthomonadaceae bacterium SCN 69-25]OJZ01029.1 MAG: mangotoxin biosynthesis-involved protein MgoB [Xanthomonadales bacterium 69-70]